MYEFFISFRHDLPVPPPLRSGQGRPRRAIPAPYLLGPKDLPLVSRTLFSAGLIGACRPFGPAVRASTSKIKRPTIGAQRQAASGLVFSRRHPRRLMFSDQQPRRQRPPAPDSKSDPFLRRAQSPSGRGILVGDEPRHRLSRAVGVDGETSGLPRGSAYSRRPCRVAQPWSSRSATRSAFQCLAVTAVSV